MMTENLERTILNTLLEDIGRLLVVNDGVKLEDL